MEKQFKIFTLWAGKPTKTQSRVKKKFSDKFFILEKFFIQNKVLIDIKNQNFD